jgi:thiamine-phosphate diphosphorylase
MVQFRDKVGNGRRLYEVAAAIRRITLGAGALFIVNDRLDVALAVGADGLHVGNEDIPPQVARRLLPPGAILGVSAATPEEALEAEGAGADYVGVGPIFATATKPDAGEAVGPERIAAVRAVTKLPILAIGGITAENAALAMSAGASGVAVIASVAAAPDMLAEVRRLRAVAQGLGGPP